MKNRLLWKLLLINAVPVILVIIPVIWWAIDHLAAAYFMELMDAYDISPTEIHSMFLASVHKSLLWSSLVALTVAALLSYLLTRRVLTPLSQMHAISEKIATGDFASRVEVTTTDEVGDLGLAFNRMADSLARVEQLRKNMVADLAHELRTPLTNLCGYLEAVNDQVLPPSRETLQMLQRESLHLVHLVEELGQLARADAAGVVLHRTPVAPAKEMERMLRLYSPKFNAKKIRVKTDLPPLAPLLTDRDKLLQALCNLFENCLKYTPEEGWVHLSVDRCARGIRFACTNSGPGIAAEDLPYIFERFFRTDRSRTREAGGFGIGLAITKQLIEAQGGEVGATSNAEATTVWFMLPE